MVTLWSLTYPLLVMHDSIRGINELLYHSRHYSSYIQAA